MQTHIDRIVCYGAVNLVRYVKLLRVPPDKMVYIRHPADHHFWRPLPVEPERLICSAVGQEYQDYPKLISALRGLHVELNIAGYTPVAIRAAQQSARKGVSAQCQLHQALSLSKDGVCQLQSF